MSTGSTGCHRLCFPWLAAWLAAPTPTCLALRHLDNERGLRNLLAHRTSRFLTMAPDSAQALRSLAAIRSRRFARGDDRVPLDGVRRRFEL